MLSYLSKVILNIQAAKPAKVEAVGTMKPPLSNVVDDVEDWFGKSILLELVSAELDPSK